MDSIRYASPRGSFENPHHIDRKKKKTTTSTRKKKSCNSENPKRRETKKQTRGIICTHVFRGLSRDIARSKEPLKE
jgi:hypothetical protein